MVISSRFLLLKKPLDGVIGKCRTIKGFTFVEIMLSLIIFSVGVTAIFSTFLLSLDQMNHLTNRIYANTQLDNQILTIERILRVHRALPFDSQNLRKNNLGHRELIFQGKTFLTAVEDLPDVFALRLELTWDERARSKRLSRSAYLLDLPYIYN